jgi:glyoxylase-like metal-dependent hydrolase (beta-lactamase superfamily II)
VIDVEDALVAAGLDPTRVCAVVNSHLHFDHCGQNPTYYGTKVPVFVQRDEVDDARARFYTVPEWASVPDDQLRALSGDETIAEGVRVVATPGHTRGHQSVVVEAQGESVVIAAQAVWNIEEFHNEEATASNVDSEELRGAAVASIRRLKAINPKTAYFSHHRGIYRRTR